MIDFEQFKLDMIPLWRSEEHGFFWHSLYVDAVYRQNLIKKIIGFQENNFYCTHFNGVYTFSLSKEEISANEECAHQFFNSERYESFIREINTLIRWPIYLSVVPYEWKSWKKRFNILCKQYFKTVSYYTATETYYTNALYNKIKGRYEESLIHELTRPHKMPSDIELELDWFDLCLKGLTDFELTQAFSRFLQKWQYNFCSHKFPPMDEEYLKRRYLQDLSRLHVMESTANLIRDSYSLESLAKRELKLEKLPEEDAKIFKTISQIGYYRMELRHVWMKLGYLINELLKVRFPFNYTKALEYGYEEIKCKHLPSFITRREFVHLRRDGKDLLLSNGLEQCLKSELNEAEGELKGTSSYGNIQKGEALVVEESDGFKMDTQGKIMVVSQITPVLIPSIINASGIIAEEGGITGHAVIVAREMQKSIIVGVKNAQKRVKSGSLVMLDTSLCEVRILQDE